MSDPHILEMLRNIKKSRLKLDVLDLTKVKKVTSKDFFTELETIIALNFESPTKMKDAVKNGLAFEVILPDSVSHPMYIEVFFDTAGAIVEIDVDPGNSVHDKFCDMLFISDIRLDIEICST